MSKVAIQGNASGTGTFTIAAPNSNTDRTLTLPDEAGTVLTSGGAIDVNASAPADSVVIDSSGNVGIGTSSPSDFRLNVVRGTGMGTEPTWESSARNLALFETDNAEGYIVMGAPADGFSAIAFADAGSKSSGFVGYSHASNALRLAANGVERTRITSNGATKMLSFGSSPWNFDGTYHESVNAYASQPAHLFYSTNASFVNEHLSSVIYRSASSAYSFYKAYSGNTADTEFTLRGDGQAYADGSWNGGGADYAEYFEWSDGNTSNEDRRGYTVVLDGNQIRKATDADDASQIIGAVSATPCVIGDHADNKWSGKFLKDDFGNYLYDEHNVVEWTDDKGIKHSYEDWNIPEGVTVPDDAVVLTEDENGNPLTHRRLNPDYDPDAEYVTRENRPEWSPIGMMGKLRIRTGQPVGDRWIKMRDISDSVEEWLVR